MKNIVKINKGLGWFLIISIISTQSIITKITYDEGGMAPFIAFLAGALLLPFFIIAIVSVLNRERNLEIMKMGIKTALFSQVGLVIILLLIFEGEILYLSLLGVVLGIIIWFFRKRIEIQLLVLNGIGLLFLYLVSFTELLHS